MRFVLEINLGNEEMQTPVDVENAVAKALYKMGDGAVLAVGDRGAVTDANGNRVGGWSVTYGEAQEREA